MSRAELVARVRASLSLRTAIALVVGGAAAVAFLEITGEVLEGETTGFDRAVALGIHRHDTPALDDVMRAFTFLGSAWFVAPLVAAVAIVAIVRGRRTLAGLVIAVSAATALLNVGLKDVIRRARPTLFTEIPRPHSFSFPSGHAMVSTAVYGVVAYAAARAFPRGKPLFFAGAALLVLLIGLSRVYLGVHWPTDVLAGFAAGAIVLSATVIATRPRQRRSNDGAG